MEPLDLPEDPAPAQDAMAMDLLYADVVNGSLTAEGVELGSGGQMMTPEWMLFPVPIR